MERRSPETHPRVVLVFSESCLLDTPEIRLSNVTHHKGGLKERSTEIRFAVAPAGRPRKQWWSHTNKFSTYTRTLVIVFRIRVGVGGGVKTWLLMASRMRRRNRYLS